MVDAMGWKCGGDDRYGIGGVVECGEMYSTVIMATFPVRVKYGRR